MQLIIAVNCSSRKTAAAAKDLAARTLPRGSVTEVATAWRKRIASADKKLSAGRLYNGRAFSLASSLAQSTGAEFRIISAGVGLVNDALAIPSYSLTVSSPNLDCVLSRAQAGAPFSAQDWWRAIHAQRSGASPFRRLLKRYPTALLLIAVTEPYLRMIEDELADLPASLLRRVRILGARRVTQLPIALRASAMPYDQRLDDVLSVLRGTQFDFPARALVHFVDLIGRDPSVEAAASHARRIRQSLAHRTAPTIPKRSRLTPEALATVIRGLKRDGYSKTAALRVLRSERGMACEQARFALAWIKE